MTRRPVCIRDYEEADERQLLALVSELQDHEGAVFDRMKPGSAIGPWYVDVLKRDCAKYGGTILVAVEAGRLLGYATVMTAVEQDGSDDEIAYTYAYVGDLAVLEAHRGEGIGRLLLEHCETRARAAGRRWLRIDVLARNARARDVYRRFGFAEHLVTMEKLLA